MTLDRLKLRSIEEEAENEVQQMLINAKAKKAKKAKKHTDSGRNINLTVDGMNCFNARVAAACLNRQLKGNIHSATIAVDGDRIITLVRLTEKDKKTGAVRYEVKGQTPRDMIGDKRTSIADLAERVVMAIRS